MVHLLISCFYITLSQMGDMRAMLQETRILIEQFLVFREERFYVGPSSMFSLLVRSSDELAHLLTTLDFLKGTFL